MAVIQYFLSHRICAVVLQAHFFWNKKHFFELKNKTTVKLAHFFYKLWKIMLRQVNWYPTCHASKLRPLVEWRQTLTLKKTRIIALAQTIAVIPHMCGLNTVFICGRCSRMRSRSLLRFHFFYFVFIYFTFYFLHRSLRKRMVSLLM